MRLAEPRRGAVIHDHTILAQHQPVAGLADRQGGEGIAVDQIEEGAGIAALNVDLAEGADITDTDRGTCGQHLAVDRLTPCRFALTREPLRPQPASGLDEHRPLLCRPVM